MGLKLYSSCRSYASAHSSCLKNTVQNVTTLKKPNKPEKYTESTKREATQSATAVGVWWLNYGGILTGPCGPTLVGVAVAFRLLHIHAELVLLVTAHVGVAHEIQRVVVRPRSRGHEIQLHLSSKEEQVLGWQQADGAPAQHAQTMSVWVPAAPLPGPAHLGFLLQRQPLDGDEAVGFGVADHHPPTFLTFLPEG